MSGQIIVRSQARRPDVKKVMFLKCLILLLVSFAEGKQIVATANKSADLILTKTRLQPNRKSMCQERSQL